AEGQRRYIETFSPYTRQFFDRMDKPQVDAIEGIPPAIAIEQRNAVKTTRSTVGTMTEINEHMKQVWPLLATLHCRQCGQPVVKETPQRVWALVRNADIPVAWPDAEFLITFDLPLSKKLSLKESLSLIEKQGYQRLLSRTGILPVHVEARARASTGDLVEAGEHALRETTTHEYRTAAACSKSGTMPVLRAQILRLEEATDHFGRQSPESLTVIQDRIRLDDGNRARFAEACEQAYHFGKGRLTVHRLGDRAADGSVALEHGQHFSRHFHCAGCDLEYREPTPALFSFNHPLGACPTCKGFGRVIQIDYNLALPDRSLTLAGGAVKPWRTGTGAESQKDMAKFCKARKIPMDVPFRELPEKIQRWVIDGDEGYGKDREHQWPRAWYGVKGYFRWLESKAYKMHVRVLLSKYRAYVLCGGCQGNRLQNEALLYRLILDNDPSKRNGKDGIDRPVASAMTSRLGSDESALPDAAAGGMTLPDFYRLPVRDALAVIDQLIARHRPKPNEPLGLVLGEVRNRLFYLSEIGLGYLTLDRPTRSLSGGETERVNLTSCLGSRLVNTLYVLDEPSVGLHPRDTARLVKILEGLRDAGNTVVVVEHEEGVMRAADQIVDLGPGHGESGGEVVFQGTFAQILRAKDTLTGEYLSGRRTIEVPERRPVAGQASSLAPASVSERADRKSVARGLSEKVDASAARLPKDDALFANGSMDGGTRSQSPGQAGSLS
ncbi:MAG TPA: excinuclease ABC subunit A, partial [Verrucomicrobiales bacterium]|nr:excinuclease ABC subunit A [Verrucomicrobiales bacterium]